MKHTKQTRLARTSRTDPGVGVNRSPSPRLSPSRDLYRQQVSEVVCRCESSAVSGERSVNNAFTVALLAGQRTCDSQVAGSIPDWAPLRSRFGQANYTYVPLSQSSIIWYRPRG